MSRNRSYASRKRMDTDVTEAVSFVRKKSQNFNSMLERRKDSSENRI